MLEFRRRAPEIVSRVRRGERLVLTYRGRPVARLEPWEPPAVSAEDPLFRLPSLAEAGGGKLSNAEIDRLVYGR